MPRRVIKTPIHAKRAVKRKAKPDTNNEALFQKSNQHSTYDASKLMDNMQIAGQLWQQIIQRMSLAAMQKPTLQFGSGDPFHLAESFMRVAGKISSQPQQYMQAGMDLAKEHLQLWHQTTQRLLGNPSDLKDVTDKRFRDSAWQDNAYFDYMKRSYLLNSDWTRKIIRETPGLDKHTSQKVEFFTNQIMDALAPSNFMMTNPQVLRTTLESNADSLVKGLQNMLEDIERGGGTLRISMTDADAFTLGVNIACTPGMVVYENDLMQLIQYKPLTKQVHEVPILLTPAWINKYYVLDLSPENSFIRWLLEQGFTVFVISWVNPDEALRQKHFEDYLAEGPLTALDVIEDITGSTQTSLIGYCLGGTLTAVTLAYLRAHGEADRVASATYLTTMIDFTDAGDLSVFIDEEQLESLEGRMDGKGYLEANEMAQTFNMLRANDLIWSFFVNNYLLGKEPMAFDLLYWNSDATHMPSAMHSFYLRNMYQRNLLAKPNGIDLLDTPINVTKIETPTYILSTIEDHIAPWQSTYAATQIYDGPVRFTLSQSGHIAGVINPPSKQKYGYWTSEKLSLKPLSWLEQAEFHAQQSWWNDWLNWQKPRSGKMVKPPQIGGGIYTPIEAAPGAYARIQAE